MFRKYITSLTPVRRTFKRKLVSLLKAARESGEVAAQEGDEKLIEEDEKELKEEDEEEAMEEEDKEPVQDGRKRLAVARGQKPTEDKIEKPAEQSSKELVKEQRRLKKLQARREAIMKQLKQEEEADNEYLLMM